MGPITARIAGAIAASFAGLITGLLVKAGLAVSPDLATAIGDFATATANLLVTAATLAAYGVGHKLFAKEAPAAPAPDAQ